MQCSEEEQSLLTRLDNECHILTNRNNPLSMMDDKHHYAQTTRDSYRLSPREREVLAALADGFSQKQVGQNLFIATNTVNTHIQKIYQKLNVHSAAGAVAKAIREGVIV